MSYNIYQQIHKELDDFFSSKVKIAGTKANDNKNRYLNKKTTDYEFSQWDTINLIDLYYNSKFETGVKDSEGQRKIFLNVCKFRADVASKQIDIDVKDFNFVPDDGTSPWGSFLLGREFKDWSKENYFGELINTWVDNFPKYGWIVAKEVDGQLEDVPIQTIRNQQDAKNLATAKYVIIEHKDMTLSEMKDMKNWNTEGLEMKESETATVYERYAKVPVSLLKEVNNDEYGSDDDEMVDAVVICTYKATKENHSGHIFFAEKLNKRPFTEAHWKKQHGRLMGVGEIENLFENQIGSNMSFNLYRRQLLWSSKKIFQSPMADEIGKNLVRDVKDGDVLNVGVNGNISQVDMANRASADFNNFSQILNNNSDQKSFTYEVATGASLPSGTPFRLGVVLSNAVNSHFDRKREQLGIFLKKGILELILPKWKKQYSHEHIVTMFADDEGFEALKLITFQLNVNKAIFETLMEGRAPAVDALKLIVREKLDGERFLPVTIPKDFYKNIKSRVTLTITGEEIDLPKKMETMTTLYQAMVAKGDPRSEKVLRRILSYAGENYDILAGMEPPQPMQQVPGAAPGTPTPAPTGSSIPSPVTPSAPMAI